MRIMPGAVVAGLSCLLSAASVGVCASAPVPGKATLNYELGVGNVIFPSRVLHGSFSLDGTVGKVDIAGTSVAVAFRNPTLGKRLGVDCKCKGSLNDADFVLIKDRSASFVIKLPDGDKTRDVAITFSDLWAWTSGNAVSSVSGRVSAASCMKGTIAGIDVRLFDENLDGKFTQDGSDSISIGNAPAVPLLKRVCIGTTFYDLTVSPDGKTIDYAPANDVKTGLVELPIKSPALKCLVFASDDGAYDLVAQGKTGIPAGQYHFVYGLLAQGGDACPIEPTQSMQKYDIAADSNNKLLFGPTCHVEFSATLADGKVAVKPRAKVLGAGGEHYDVDIRTSAARPHVVLLEGDKVILENVMGQDPDGDVLGFSQTIPRQMSAAKGGVAFTTVIPGMGKVAGKKTLDELTNGTTQAQTDKKEDKPAVVSTPILAKQP